MMATLIALLVVIIGTLTGVILFLLILQLIGMAETSVWEDEP